MDRRTARGTFQNDDHGGGETIESWPDGHEVMRWSGYRTHYVGDLVGEATVHCFGARFKNDVPSLSCFERVEGTLDGRRGTFLDQQEAYSEGGAWTGRWRVIPGSATGDLTGLRAEGRWEIAPGQHAGSWSLDYWFE